jgi:hypothetical protein
MPPAGRKQITELRALAQATAADIAECNKHILGADSPFWRRVAYRTVFSSIEALTSHMKQSALLLSEDRRALFTDAERLALRDVEYAIEDTGVIAERKARIRMLPNLWFALARLAKVSANGCKLEKKAGWDSLTRSVKVRDRITHPKRAEDYSITDSEMKDLNDAWQWFGKALVEASTPKKG